MADLYEFYRKNIYIFYVVLTNALAFTSLGAALSWASPSMVKLMRSDSPIPMDESQGSWTGSLLAIGAVAISVPYTYFFTKTGRKHLIIGLALFYISGWITLICSSQVWHVYLGRFLLGAAVGPTYGVVPAYLAEVVGKSVRGASVAILIIAQSCGALMQYSVGPVVSLNTHNWISLSIPLVFLAFASALPESPYYLIGVGKKSEAEKVLQRLRGAEHGEEIKEEFENIQTCLVESPPMVFKDLLKELSSIKTKKAIAIIAVATFAQQFSGVGAIVVYMETIFIDMKSPIVPKNAVIIAEILADVTALMTLLIIDKIGRKPLLATSAFVCVTAHVLVGVFFYLHGSTMPENFSYLGVISIFLVQIGYGMGLGSVPVLIMSEVMSFSLKGWLAGFYQIVQGTYNASSIKIFQIVNTNYGAYYSFWMFALCIFSSVFTLMFLAPETKNKTLQEIQLILSGEKNYKKSNDDNVESTL